jgi:hypothetical protein
MQDLTAIVVNPDGSHPYRTDGQPLTQIDRDVLAGVNPLDCLEALAGEKLPHQQTARTTP